MIVGQGGKIFLPLVADVNEKLQALRGPVRGVNPGAQPLSQCGREAAALDSGDWGSILVNTQD